MANLLDDFNEKEAGIFGIALAAGLGIGIGLRPYTVKQSIRALRAGMGSKTELDVTDDVLVTMLESLGLQTLLLVAIESDSESNDKLAILDAISRLNKKAGGK